MRKVLTKDGSETFVNEKVGQSYHSFTGAVEEALKKFCEPCEIAKIAAQKGKIKILDVCFGLGYNSAMAIDVALKARKDCEIEIVGLENDPEVLDKIKELKPKIEGFEKFWQIDSKNLEFSYSKIKVKVLLGDARERIKELKNEEFDACFFDPFSPSIVPEMWSTDFFKQVYRVMKKGAKMATYSCARLARDNIKAANFDYADGPKVGRRGPGTLAWK